jgi:hypothetical protein
MRRRGIHKGVSKLTIVEWIAVAVNVIGWIVNWHEYCELNRHLLSAHYMQRVDNDKFNQLLAWTQQLADREKTIEATEAKLLERVKCECRQCVNVEKKYPGVFG